MLQLASCFSSPPCLLFGTCFSSFFCYVRQTEVEQASKWMAKLPFPLLALLFMHVIPVPAPLPLHVSLSQSFFPAFPIISPPFPPAAHPNLSTNWVTSAIFSTFPLCHSAPPQVTISLSLWPSRGLINSSNLLPPPSLIASNARMWSGLPLFDYLSVSLSIRRWRGKSYHYQNDFCLKVPLQSSGEKLSLKADSTQVHGIISHR